MQKNLISTLYLLSLLLLISKTDFAQGSSPEDSTKCNQVIKRSHQKPGFMGWGDSTIEFGDKDSICASDMDQASKDKYACGLLPPGAIDRGSTLTNEDFSQLVEKNFDSFTKIEGQLQSCHKNELTEKKLPLPGVDMTLAEFQGNWLPWIQFTTGILDMLADVSIWQQAASAKYTGCVAMGETSAIVMASNAIATTLLDLSALYFYARNFLSLNEYIDEEFGAEIKSEKCKKPNPPDYCSSEEFKNLAPTKYEVNAKYSKVLKVLEEQTSHMIWYMKLTITSTALGIVGDGITALLAAAELFRMAVGCPTPDGPKPPVPTLN